jgi:hypothetical protein
MMIVVVVVSENSATAKQQVPQIVAGEKEMLWYSQDEGSDDAHKHTGKFKSVGYLAKS